MSDEAHDGLQVAEDPQHERRAQVVQRATWTVVCLALLSALAGAFGEGVLSSATATAPGGTFQVEYERTARVGAADRLEVHLRGGDGRPEVGLSRAWVDDHQLQEVVPEAESVRAERDRVVWTFEAGQAATVLFDVQPQTAGVHRLRVDGPGGASAVVHQLVWP